jgi:hypothetical protein
VAATLSDDTPAEGETRLARNRGRVSHEEAPARECTGALCAEGISRLRGDIPIGDRAITAAPLVLVQRRRLVN